MRLIQVQPVNDRTQSWTIFAILTVVMVVAYFWHPNDQGIVLCYFRYLTGLPCAGCGLTRSLSAFAKGQFLTSFQYHPFGPLVFLIGIGLWLRAIVELFNQKTVTIVLSEKTKRRLIPLFIIFIISFWAYRIIDTLSHR
ncbi:MAG: DUF2752 domain-containing protein [bacterium]|nr:DUF2752 domain-containing protein [bacterium]